MTNPINGTALVTGAASGVGLGISQRLLREGWRVVLTDLDERAGLLRERQAVDRGEDAVFRAMDVCDRDDVDAVVGWTVDRFGALELLVNNAGVQVRGRIENLDWSDWARVIDVNLHGVFNCLQAAGRAMLEAGSGCLVNIGSIAGERGAPGRAAYCSSKAAVLALTRVAAVEWASRGIRVNAVAPGFVETTMVRAAIDSRHLDEASILARIPAGRMASPAEIAAVVSYLASPDASYVTGQTFFVDGGFLADYGVDYVRPSQLDEEA